MPVPLAGESVLAMEQAISAVEPQMTQVLFNSQVISKRSGFLFDNLPWAWNPSTQAKRDAFARFSGRGFSREGYASPYHLVLDMMRRDACADVSHVLVEKTNVLGGGLVLGGTLALERRLPPSVDSGAAYAMGSGPAPASDARWWVDASSDDASADAFLCDCTTDEALGIALALDGCVHVERAIWEACRLRPQYNMQRGNMRIEVAPGLDLVEGAGAVTERPPSPVPLPWDIKSSDELFGLSIEEKALSAMAAGLNLPRARDATDDGLLDLLDPLLDESVRTELRVRRALEAGEADLAAALETGASRRYQLTAALRDAVSGERYGEAARLAEELRVETSRRLDVTMDEGAYDRYLDQDDWYAQSLAKERERALQRDREREAEKEAQATSAREAAKKAEERAAAKQRAVKEAAAARVKAEVAARKAAERQAQGAPAAPPPTKAPPDGPQGGPRVGSRSRGFRFETTTTPPPPFEAVLASSAPGGQVPVKADESWTEELQTAVLRQMVLAFDNYQTAEVEDLLSSLVKAATAGDADAERSLRKLAYITRQLEGLQRRASSGTRDVVMLEDEARTLFSQIRMWGKDGERYSSSSTRSSSWLGWLEGLRTDL